MPKLDGDRQVAQVFANSREHRRRGLVRLNPGRELQQDRAQLARFVEGFDRAPKLAPHFVAQLPGQILRVHASGRRERGRKLIANRSRKPCDVRRMAGHERVCLHVEHEIARCALDPVLDDAHVGNGVEAHVGFDQRKLRGVMFESRFGSLCVGGIEDARRGERLVGPAGGPDADLRAAAPERLGGAVHGPPGHRGQRAGVVRHVGHATLWALAVSKPKNLRPKVLRLTLTGPPMAASDVDLVRGTLDLLILKTLSWGPMHGLAVLRWIENVTRDQLQIEEGALYPALHRMEEKGWLDADWGYTERNRKAKFYRLTARGRKHLADELTRWQRYTSVVGLIIAARGAGAGAAR